MSSSSTSIHNRPASMIDPFSSTHNQSPSTSYLVLCPMKYDDSSVEKIQKIARMFLDLCNQSNGTDHYSIIFGMNLKREDYQLVEKEFKKFNTEIENKYFHTPITLKTINFPWSQKNSRVDYCEIRNNLWYSSMVNSCLQILIKGMKPKQQGRIQILTIDPDTAVSERWISEASMTNALVTAGYYDYCMSNQPAFIDQNGNLKWNGIIAEIGNRFDIIGKKAIGSKVFLNYVNLKNFTSKYDVTNKKDVQKLIEEDLESFIKVIKSNRQLLSELKYRSVSDLKDCYSDIEKMTSGYKKPLTKHDKTALMQLLPDSIHELFCQEKTHAKILEMVSVQVLGMRILYPNEALMQFNVYSKNDNQVKDYSKKLFAPNSHFWGNSGRGEGQYAVMRCNEIVDQDPVIDYVESPNYRSEMPDRVAELSKVDPSDLSLPSTLPFLNPNDRKLLQTVTIEACEKPQSCLSSAFLNQRKWYIHNSGLFSREEQMPLSIQFKNFVTNLQYDLFSRMKYKFSERMFIETSLSEAESGLTNEPKLTKLISEYLS